VSLHSIKKQLDALAQKFAPAAPMVVTIRGGPSAAKRLHAVAAGGHCWERFEGESVGEFRTRAVAAATRRGAVLLCIRGSADGVGDAGHDVDCS